MEIKPEMMRLTGHVECMKEMRTLHNVLFKKPEGKNLLSLATNTGIISERSFKDQDILGFGLEKTIQEGTYDGFFEHCNEPSCSIVLETT
jgi:hypothetical protein